ncbi:MAG: transposase [Lentisphaeria bacterium]
MGKHFTDDFKQQLIDLHLQGKQSVVDLSKSYGLAVTTLRGWIKQAEKIMDHLILF